MIEPMFWYIDFGLENVIKRVFRHPQFQADRANWRPLDWMSEEGQSGSTVGSEGTESDGCHGSGGSMGSDGPTGSGGGSYMNEASSGSSFFKGKMLGRKGES